MKKYTKVVKATKVQETLHISGFKVHLTKGWRCDLACGHRKFFPAASRGDAPLRTLCKRCQDTTNKEDKR